MSPPQISCDASEPVPGSPLQEDIASALRRLLQLGQDIRGGEQERGQADPLYPERLRQLPAQFSWIDHCLVREHYIEKATVYTWTLYLFLLCVADALSYYAEAMLSRRLGLPLTRLAQARRDLIALDLIAYDPLLYQVLSLPEAVPVAVRLEQLRTSLEGRS